MLSCTPPQVPSYTIIAALSPPFDTQNCRSGWKAWVYRLGVNPQQEILPRLARRVSVVLQHSLFLDFHPVLTHMWPFALLLALSHLRSLNPAKAHCPFPPEHPFRLLYFLRHGCLALNVLGNTHSFDPGSIISVPSHPSGWRPSFSIGIFETWDPQTVRGIPIPPQCKSPCPNKVPAVPLVRVPPLVIQVTSH